MNTFPELLQLSQQQYRALISKTEEIGNRVHDLDPDTIRAYQKDLSILLDNAQKTDHQINEMAMNHLGEVSNKLFQERAEIMKHFLELNRTVATRLSDKQAVIRAEYLKIKNGRVGVSGYQSFVKKPHRIINSLA